MTFRDMTKDELVSLLEARADDAATRDRLIQELEVHQAELETQNQQLREAQLLLEESRSLYADLYDFAPVGYATLDEAGCIVQVNLAGAALLRRERIVLLGMPLATLLEGADRVTFREYLATSLRSLESTTQLELDVHDRSIRLVSIAYRDVLTGSRRCRTMFLDVTEQKRAEDAIRLSLRMREDFLAIVSHELRNPLNAVALATQVLFHELTETERDHKHRPQLEAMQRATTRMDRLLADLLDLSSMDTGQLAMRIGEHSVSALVDAATEVVAGDALGKGVQLDCSGVKDDVVRCDRERIVQALVNLAGNAIKFTPRGGRVAFTVEPSDTEIVFSVEDSGIGIREAQQAQIFAPYWQVDRRAKRGTGLGLSIVRGIVECHGGEVGVKSQLGQGATFSFTLAHGAAKNVDGVDRPGRSSNVQRTVERATEKQGVVLVVDDEADTREALAELLRLDAYRVVTARDGAEALAALARERISVILLDLVMPGVDGWQFLDRRAADQKLAVIPVILISGQANAIQTAESLALDGAVEKPIDRERLRRALAGVAAAGNQAA